MIAGIVGKQKTKKLSKKQKETLVQKIKSRIKRIFWHKDFDDPSMERNILSPIPDLESYLEECRKIREKYPTTDRSWCVRACYEGALLTREQEFHLFRQYNFYKYRAKKKLEKNQIKLAAADLKLADDVRRILTCANVRLAMPIVRKYTNNRHYEDLISESYYLILKALDCFDFNRGVKFSTYGTWVIVRTMQGTAMKLNQHDKRHQTGFDKEDFTRVASTSESEETLEQTQRRDLIKKLLDHCNEREQKVLKDRFFKGITLKAIAADLNLSKERIRQIELVALSKISQRAQDMGITADQI